MEAIDRAIAEREGRIAELARIDDGGDTHAESNRLFAELQGLRAVRDAAPA